MYDYYKQYCKSNYMRIGRSMIGLVSYILRNALNPRKREMIHLDNNRYHKKDLVKK